MKISKRQLRRIIKEEKSRLAENRLVGSIGFGSNAERARRLAEQPISGEQAVQMQTAQNPLFQSRYIRDLFMDDFADIEAGSSWVSEESFAKFETAVMDALTEMRRDFVDG